MTQSTETQGPKEEGKINIVLEVQDGLITAEELFGLRGGNK